MAESSLTTTYSDIQKEVGRELGWGRTPGTDTDTARVDWTKENFTDFGLIAKEGYRQFLYPEPLPGENKSHNWSFLYPLGQLTLNVSYTGLSTNATNDCSLANGLVTLRGDVSDPVNPAWAVGNEFLVDGERYFILTAVAGNKTLTVDDSTAGFLGFKTFEFARRYYDLPDDFGGMVSEGFTYRRDEQWHLPDIRIVGEGDVRKVDRTTTGDIYPKVATLTPIAPTAATGGSGGNSSRWRVSFYPRPEQAYEVEYRYHAIPPALDASTNIYHYGGAEHSSTIIASIVDVAYQKIRASTEKHEYFLTRLRQSVLHDRRNYQPQYIGPGSKSRGDYSERDALREFRSSISTSNISTTFS